MNRTAPQTAGPDLLLVAPNWLGDLVMFTSLLEMLAPDAGAAGAAGAPRPAVAVRAEWLPLLDGDPRVGRLLPYERSGGHRGLRGTMRLAGEWRRGGFETTILGPPSLRVAAAAAMASIPRRIGFRGDGRSPLLTDPILRPRRGTLHYTAELRLLHAAWAGDPALAAAPPPEPRLPAPAVADADPRLAGGPPTWAVAVGATYGAAKEWPVDHAAAFAAGIVRRRGARVLMLGDAAARRNVPRLRRKSDVPWRDDPAGGAGVVDLVGRTTLVEAAVLLRGADVFVGNDSGLMHLAAALGTPTVGIFGSTSPAWTGPRGPRTTVAAAEGFDCQPCFRRTCNRPRFCLDALTPSMVLDAADRLVASGEEGTR